MTLNGSTDGQSALLARGTIGNAAAKTALPVGDIEDAPAVARS
jgi:hypothetical protein